MAADETQQVNVEQDRRSIIDARVRLPQELRAHKSYAAPARQTAQYDQVLGLTDKMNTGSLADLLEAMDGVGVAHAVMHAESEGGEDALQLNDALVEVLAEHPERFKGIGGVNTEGSTPTQIARQVATIHASGLLGVTLQPAFLGLDIDDRSLYPMYSRAEELGLVVAIHTGITYSRVHPLRHERAELLDQVACDFPDLRLIACHAGWPYVTEYCAVARRHPTVFLEFGGLAPKYVAKPGTGWDAVFAMMPNVLRGQVLYGSDWPVMAPERAVAEWNESGLGPATLQALLHDNSASLFGFSPEPE